MNDKDDKSDYYYQIIGITIMLHNFVYTIVLILYKDYQRLIILVSLKSPEKFHNKTLI